MTETDWIGRAEALERLGVRAQTLYAYVSRGRIGMRPDPQDSRRSLYSAADLERLALRRRRGRKASAIAASAMAWGEPSIPTRISTIERGRPAYRGRDSIELSVKCSLEDAAALLWEQSAPIRLACETAAGEAHDSPMVALARLAGASMAGLGRSPASLGADGARAIGRLALALGLGGGDAPVHERLARAWAVGPDAAALLRRALVLRADPDLSASTFAVRVAASPGASIPACLLAGLATLSGPRHGGAAAALSRLAGSAEELGARAALEQWLASGQALPGFGHPLYPEGDSRADALLERMEPDPAMAALGREAQVLAGLRPNIDFALVAATRACRLPQDAPFTLFALGRSTGWVAHAIEQVTTGGLIRPRARYEG